MYHQLKKNTTLYVYFSISFQVLKLYAWEKSFMSKVSAIRKKELRQLKNAAYLNASFAFTFTCAPFMVSCIFTSYVYCMCLEQFSIEC